MYFVFGWVKIFKTLWFLCDRSHQIICILQICHLCYCAVGVKAHKENNKVLIFCASKYKLHVAETKHNVKTPDTIFYYTYWAYQIVFFCLVINIILGVMSCHDHLRRICSYTLIFREYPQLTHRLALQFLVMPIVFVHIILQTWSWLKSKNLTILVMRNNGIAQCKVTFVQASCFINGISDNKSITVWKTIFFLQTCATREYDVITNAGTYRCFSKGTLWKSVCLAFVFFTPPNRTWGNLTSFSHSYLRTHLEFRPPVYALFWVLVSEISKAF